MRTSGAGGSRGVRVCVFSGQDAGWTKAQASGRKPPPYGGPTRLLRKLASAARVGVDDKREAGGGGETELLLVCFSQKPGSADGTAAVLVASLQNDSSILRLSTISSATKYLADYS